MPGKFGVKKFITSAGIIESEIDIFEDTKIRLVVASAGVTNEIAVYGKIGGQGSWTLVGSIIGNGTKDFTVSLFDFVRLECITYSSLGARVDLAGSGFQLTSGIPTIGVPGGGEITDVDNLQFTSSDNSISFTATAPSTIDIIANPASNLANNQLSNLISPTSVNQDLLPDTTNTRSLGSITKRWEDLHVGTTIVLDNGSQSITETLGVLDNKISSNTKLTIETLASDLVLSSAGNISANTNQIKDVVDPTSAQDASTKNYVDTGLALKIDLTEKGSANGVATLDAGQKVPLSQLPNSIMGYKGVYNASTNTPALADGAGNPDTAIGDVYKVSVAGTQNFGSGAITFVVGDYVILNDSKIWGQAHAGGDAVNSVNGQAGIVVLDSDDIAEGVTNLYFTNERAQDAVGTILTDSSKIDFTYDDTANTITATLVANSITDGDISPTAGIDASKISSGVVSNTEFDTLNGVTSAIQTQLNGKATTALDNLASTAVNADILPATTSTVDLGSATKTFAEVHTDKLVTYDSTDPTVPKLSIGLNAGLGNSILGINDPLRLYSGNTTLKQDTRIDTVTDSTDNSGNIRLKAGDTTNINNRGYVQLDGSEVDLYYHNPQFGVYINNFPKSMFASILIEGGTLTANTATFTNLFDLYVDRGAALSVSCYNSVTGHSLTQDITVAYNSTTNEVVYGIGNGVFTGGTISTDVQLQVVTSITTGLLKVQFVNNNLTDAYELKCLIKKF